MQDVAVKQVLNVTVQSETDFKAEADLLMKLRPHGKQTRL